MILHVDFCYFCHFPLSLCLLTDVKIMFFGVINLKVILSFIVGTTIFFFGFTYRFVVPVVLLRPTPGPNRGGVRLQGPDAVGLGTGSGDVRVPC